MQEHSVRRHLWTGVTSAPVDLAGTEMTVPWMLTSAPKVSNILSTTE